MNSKTSLYVVALSILSTTPAIQRDGEYNRPKTANSITCVNKCITQMNSCSSVSFVEQYIPVTDYKNRYKRIVSSAKFKAAYRNRSLGESILIED